MLITVDQLQVEELFDTGSFGDAQDPALTIKIGKESKTTERKVDAKTKASFGESYVFEITKQEYDNGILVEVEVNNVNSGMFAKKIHIGKARASLKNLAPKLNEAIPVVINLIHEGKKGPVDQGKVMLRLKVDYKETSPPAAKQEATKTETQPKEPTKPLAQEPTKGAAKEPTKMDEKSAVAAEALDPAKQPEKKLDPVDRPTLVKQPQEAAKREPDDGMSKVPEQMKLIIEKIHVEDLKDKGGFMDHQDPSVMISVGKNSQETERIVDAGTRADFPEKFEIVVTGKDYSEGITMEVEVSNMAKSKAKTHVGHASVSLKGVITSLNTPYPVQLPLTYKKDKQQGLASFTAILIEDDPQPKPVVLEPKLVEDKTPAAKEEKKDVSQPTSGMHSVNLSKEAITIIKVKDIIADVTKNVEIMIMDKNDLYVVTKVAEKWTNQTSVKDNAGLHAEWQFDSSDQTSQFKSTWEELSGFEWDVKVYDHNDMLAHTLIGEGKIILSPQQLSVLQKSELNFKVPLLSKKKKPIGEVTYILCSKPDTAKKETAETTAKAPDSAPSKKQIKEFLVGTLNLSKIVCEGLTNVEALGGKNDPYVEIKLGTHIFKTESIDGAGASAVFDYLGQHFAVDRDILEFEKLKVKVTDKNNTLSDVLIGEGSVSLLYLVENVDEEQVVSLNISNAKGKETGKVKLFFTLTAEQADGGAIDKNLASFKQGELRIVRIRAQDVPDIHNKTIHIQLRSAAWEYTTQTVDLSSLHVPIFDHLDSKMPIYSSELSKAVLTGEVILHGFMGKSVVASGTCNLKQCAARFSDEVEVTMDLVRKGSASGRLIIFTKLFNEAQLKEEQAELKVCAEFLKGYYLIRSLALNGMRNTEFWGGKQDPYVKLSFGEWTYKTKVLSNEGGDVTWDDLNVKLPVDREALDLKQLELTVMDDNTLRGDTIVGTSKIDLRKGCKDLEKEVSISSNINDKKGKLAGRITINGALYNANDDTKLELPKDMNEGFLRVMKITGKDLSIGNLVITPAPSFEVKYGDWKASTTTSDNKSPTWSNLGLESPVMNKDAIASIPFVITLTDHKKIVASAELPNLLVAGSRFGQPTLISLPLLHIKNKSSVGSVDIELSILPIDQRKPDILLEVKERKLDYTDAELNIGSIHLKNLVNTEWFGKADPFLIISYADWMEQTAPYMNAGSDVIWNDLNMRTETTSEELLAKELEITVYDKNSLRSNAVIGKVKLSLKRLAVSPGKEIVLSEQLLDNRNKVAGICEIRAEVRKLDTKNVPQLPVELTSVEVHCFRISTFDLKNTEWTGKQDPFVTLKVGKEKIQSPVEQNAGSDTVFENLDMKIILPKDALQREHMNVEVWDQNNTGHRLIGTGVASLRSLRTLKEEKQIPVKLVTKDGSPAGRVLLFLTVDVPPPTAEEEEALDMKTVVPANFQTGWLDIVRIASHGLRNSAILGGMLGNRQDPYVELSLGEWSDKSEVKENGGTDCTWDLLDLSAPVKADDLRTGAMKVIVKHKGIANDEVIGTGSCKVIRAAEKVNEEVLLKVKLVDKANKPAGTIDLYVKLHEDERDSDYKIPLEFTYGVFKVTAIEAFHLKNTEFMGKQDPFVTLKLGDLLNVKTYTKDNAGVQASWDHLPYQCDLYKDALESTQLEITVYDENTSRPNVMIGKGSVNLVKCAHFLDKDVMINTLVYDTTNKVSGKIRLHCKIAIPEPEAEIPKDYVEGTLRIKQVSAFGLQRSEFFGLSKTDPYAIVTVNSIAKKTKVLNNHGGNPAWDFLDFEYLCDNKTARVGEIGIDLMDSNNVTSDKKLGTALIPIKKFAAKLGVDMEVTGQLLNSKGQAAGDLVLNGQLEPRKAVAKIELGLPEDFISGYLLIYSLQAKGLKNTEITGKSDPYARFELGDWEETTSTLNGAGSSPSWPELSCQAEVNREILASSSLKIVFFDENGTRGDVAIGSGGTSLRPLCERIGKRVKLVVPIGDKSGAVTGEAVINAMITKGDPSLMTELPESAVVVEKGILKILEVSSFDLGGGDKGLLDNKPDPYITFQIGDSKDLIGKTPVIPNGGRNVRWDSPDIDFPVSKDLLTFQRLNATVMDQNSVTKDSFMGKGAMSLRKVGSDPSGKSATYTVRLKDTRGRAAGRLEVVVAIEPMKEVTDKEAAKEDFSQLLGQFHVSEVEVTDVKNTASIGEQDLIVRLSFPTWTGQTPVSKGAGTKSKWNVKMNTKNIVAAHLQRHGLKVQVVSPSLLGESAVGDCSIPLQSVLDNANEFTDLKHQLMYNGKAFGKVKLKVRFTTDANQLQQWAMMDDQAAQDPSNMNQDSLKKQMSSMESSLKEQIQLELSKERKEMMAQIEAQNKELKSTIEKLSRNLANMKQESNSALDLRDVDLPKNISRWRTPHVQAWLAFEMELPQYLEAFASASIDGLVLLKHVDDHILKDYMHITDILHSTKLLAGIENLKGRQQRYEEHLEKKRLQKLAEEEDRKRRLEASKLKEKKDDPDKKPKKPKTFFGEVRESNILERTKIENSMKEYRAEQQKKKEKADKKSKTWHFEYTGQPKPEAESIWDNKVDARVGSESYQKTMTTDIANDIAPFPTKVRTIPTNCSTDEVLAVVKGAMYEVSTWLLEVEQMNYKRQTLLDDDLLAIDLPDLPEYDQMVNELDQMSGEVEKLEDPPSYCEFIKEAEQLNQDENFSEMNEPPLYDDLIGDAFTIGPPPITSIPPQRKTMMSKNLAETATLLYLSKQQPITDRMTLIFYALVRQQNNDARWLGPNSKLTRLKLYGGIESLLRLRLDWSQFDALWTKLDFKRSGDIDLKEFKEFFGDLSEFERREGTRSMTMSANSQSISTLTRTLYDLCDALRHAKFTVAEMFSGFDRNGSGEVSISEFCSMLRTVLGNHVDKKLLYQGMSVLDMDGNKAISLEETLFFIYRIWRTQLDDLANKLYKFEGREEEKEVQKLLEERQQIKQAIKKNFPRQWRDKLEREGQGHALPGPFHHLLKRMHINDQPIEERDAPTTLSMPAPPPMSTTPAPMLSPSRKPGRTYLAGKSTMLRFKVRLPPGTERERYLASHTTSPPKRRLDGMARMSGEAAQKMLADSDPLGGYR